MANNPFVLPKIQHEDRKIVQIQQNVEQQVNKALSTVQSSIVTLQNATNSAFATNKTGGTIAAIPNQSIFYDATAGALSASLPPAADMAGQSIFLMKTDASFNSITVNTVGTDTFLDSTSSTSLATWQEQAEFFSNGTGWIVVDRNFYRGTMALDAPVGTWVSNTVYTMSVNRYGDWGQFQLLVTLSGAPTSAQLNITLPNSLTIDTTKLISTNGGAWELSGASTARDTGVSSYPISALYSDSHTISFTDWSNTPPVRQSAFVTQAVPHTWGATDYLQSTFWLPIVGWAG